MIDLGVLMLGAGLCALGGFGVGFVLRTYKDAGKDLLGKVEWERLSAAKGKIKSMVVIPHSALLGTLESWMYFFSFLIGPKAWVWIGAWIVLRLGGRTRGLGDFRTGPGKPINWTLMIWEQGAFKTFLIGTLLSLWVSILSFGIIAMRFPMTVHRVRESLQSPPHLFLDCVVCEKQARAQNSCHD